MTRCPRSTVIVEAANVFSRTTSRIDPSAANMTRFATTTRAAATCDQYRRLKVRVHPFYEQAYDLFARLPVARHRDVSVSRWLRDAPSQSTNRTIRSEQRAPVGETGSASGGPTDLVILAFSGGGTRAAAFSYGVLEALRRIETVTTSGRKTVCSTRSM